MGPKLYFCLNYFHPTGDTGKPALPDDPTRYFASDEVGCPTCPLCNKQVSAAEVPDDKTLPVSVAQALERSKLEITV